MPRNNPGQAPRATASGAGVRTIASVDKALGVVEQLMALDSEGASLSQLAESTGLNKSSLHHILATLRSHDWIEQDDSGRYLLGPATARMARWWTSSNQVITQLHPVLEQICLRTHELVHLGRLHDHGVVYVDKVEPDRPIRVWSRIGRMAPVATTAMGRAILGARQPAAEELDGWLSRASNPSDHLRARVLEEIDRVAQEGYAVEIGEDYASLACVGVPLAVVGVPTMSISVTMPAERATLPKLETIAGTIRSCVERADLSEVTLIAPHLANRTERPATTRPAASVSGPMPE